MAEFHTQQDYIEHIMNMKNNWPGCTPQPDYAREALKKYDALLPEMKLMDGVRNALKQA